MRLAELRNGVDRSRHLISQLLDLAHAQAGSSEHLPSQSLETTVRQVIGELLPLADAANVDLEVDLADAGDQVLPVVAATSILRNLVDNAIRHNSRGGHVHLSTRVTRAGRSRSVSTTTAPASRRRRRCYVRSLGKPGRRHPAAVSAWLWSPNRSATSMVS